MRRFNTAIKTAVATLRLPLRKLGARRQSVSVDAVDLLRLVNGAHVIVDRGGTLHHGGTVGAPEAWILAALVLNVTRQILLQVEDAVAAGAGEKLVRLQLGGGPDWRCRVAHRVVRLPICKRGMQHEWDVCLIVALVVGPLSRVCDGVGKICMALECETMAESAVREWVGPALCGTFAFDCAVRYIIWLAKELRLEPVHWNVSTCIEYSFNSRQWKFVWIQNWTDLCFSNKLKTKGSKKNIWKLVSVPAQIHFPNNWFIYDTWWMERGFREYYPSIRIKNSILLITSIKCNNKTRITCKHNKTKV